MASNPSFYKHIKYTTVTGSNLETSDENLIQIQYFPSRTPFTYVRATLAASNPHLIISGFTEVPKVALISGHNLKIIELAPYDSSDQLLSGTKTVSDLDPKFVKIDLSFPSETDKIQLRLHTARDGETKKEIASVIFCQKEIELEHQFSKCTLKISDGEDQHRKALGGVGKSFFGFKFTYSCEYILETKTDLESIKNLVASERGFIFSVFDFTHLQNFTNDSFYGWGFEHSDFSEVLMLGLNQNLIGEFVGAGQRITFKLAQK